MEQEKIIKFANLLYESETTRKSIPPITDQDSSLTLDDAYAIQLENVKRVTAQGHVISGKKIGLTSHGIQHQFGVNEPDYGHLFAAMDCSASGEIKTDDLLHPKIEAELAFVLKSDLCGGKVTAHDVHCATDYVLGAFEIVDSRIADWKIKLIDTVSDNASSGRYILGDKRMAIDEIDPSKVVMDLYKNGEHLIAGIGSAVMGDPCLAVAWLANRLWSYGVEMKKGEVILSGAFSSAPEAAKGDSFEAVFSSFGSVKAKFI